MNGFEKSDEEQLPAELFEAETPLIPETACNDAFNDFKVGYNLSESFLKTDPVNELMGCAGNGLSDTCFGDSGGPLLVRQQNEYRLAGIITSRGVGCGNSRLYSVYTKVPAFVRWISDETGLSLSNIDPDDIENSDTSMAYSVRLTASGEPSAGALGLWLIFPLAWLYGG